MQTIDVAHQFNVENQESNWIVIEDQGFKGISYFDGEIQKALVLELLPHEIPKSYTKILEAFAKFLLPRTDRENFYELLEEAFSKVQAEISPNEIVLLSFAKQIEELQEERLDFLEKVEGVAILTKDLTTKILLLGIKHQFINTAKIVNACENISVSEADIQAEIDQLVEKEYIKEMEEGLYKINPDIYRISRHF